MPRRARVPVIIKSVDGEKRFYAGQRGWLANPDDARVERYETLKEAEAEAAELGGGAKATWHLMLDNNHVPKPHSGRSPILHPSHPTSPKKSRLGAMMQGQCKTSYPIRPGCFVRFKKIVGFKNTGRAGRVEIVAGYIKEDFHQGQGTHFYLIKTRRGLLRIRAQVVYRNLLEHRPGGLARAQDANRIFGTMARKRGGRNRLSTR